MARHDWRSPTDLRPLYLRYPMIPAICCHCSTATSATKPALQDITLSSGPESHHSPIRALKFLTCVDDFLAGGDGSREQEAVGTEGLLQLSCPCGEGLLVAVWALATVHLRTITASQGEGHKGASMWREDSTAALFNHHHVNTLADPRGGGQRGRTLFRV